MHDFIRADILNHISQNLHDPIPGSGGNTFDQSISVGVGIETINVAGSPSTTYSSVEHYLQIMCRLTRMLQISNSSLLFNYTELSFALPLTAQTILRHRLTIVPYATFYTIQIPSTTPPSEIPLTCGPHILTVSTQQVHLPSRFFIVCKIPHPYGIYHSPYFVASTSAPELCQPHQTDTCAHPTRFVLSGTTSRRGALYVDYMYNCDFSSVFELISSSEHF